MATFVLVHAGFHGAWCWIKLRPLLEAAGHQVYTPTLTGLGERAPLARPDVGLSTHVQDVRGLLQEHDLRDVVLVGHSYAGMVITGVAGAAPERLAHLMYLDALVPRDGEAVADVVPPEVWRYRRAARRQGDGWRVPPPRALPSGLGGLFGVTTEPDLSWVRARLTAQPLKTFEEPLRLAQPAAPAALPRTYIECAGAGPLVALVRRVVQPRLRPPAEPGWR